MSRRQLFDINIPIVTYYTHRPLDLNCRVSGYEFRPNRRMITLEREYPETYFKKSVVKKGKYYLPFPYMQFIIFTPERGVTAEVSVSFTKTPISSLNDEVYHPPLPNIYDNYKACLGPISRFASDDDVISRFWNTKFHQTQTLWQVSSILEGSRKFSKGWLDGSTPFSYEAWEKSESDKIHWEHLTTTSMNYIITKFHCNDNYELQTKDIKVKV